MHSLAFWLQTRDRFSRYDDSEPLWLPELPEIDALIQDWADSVKPAYANLLEAKPIEDDSKEAIANAIAGSIILTQWLFDRRNGNYIQPRSRKILSQAESNLLLSDRITDAKQRLGQIARQYERSRNIQDWKKQALAEIQKVHTQAYALGRGGLQSLTPTDLERLSKILNQQADYLSRFSQALTSNQVSGLRAFNRLRNYAQSAIASYWQGKEQAIAQSAFKEERWLLGAAEHCNGCLELSRLGWVPIGLLPAIGTQECLFNCKCRKDYR